MHNRPIKIAEDCRSIDCLSGWIALYFLLSIVLQKMCFESKSRYKGSQELKEHSQRQISPERNLYSE